MCSSDLSDGAFSINTRSHPNDANLDQVVVMVVNADYVPDKDFLEPNRKAAVAVIEGP